MIEVTVVNENEVTGLGANESNINKAREKTGELEAGHRQDMSFKCRATATAAR